MNANTDDGRGTEAPARGSRRTADPAATSTATARGARPAPVINRYMVSPTDPGMTTAALTQQLRDLGVTEIVRTLEPRGAELPAIAVVHATAQTAATLRRTAAPNSTALLVESDRALQPATALARRYPSDSIATAVPLGPGFTTTVQVQGENEQPVERALVELAVGQWTAVGLTGRDGKVALNLFGEVPGRPATLSIKPRAGYWGQYRSNTQLPADGSHVVALRALTLTQELPWGGRAMRFDQLGPDYRGAGSKIALIDTGVDTGHRQLTSIKQGRDATGGDDRSWSQDPAGHGTPSAGILVAAPDKGNGVRGYAPGAELYVVKLGLNAYCSDLVAALDDCIEKGIDIACVGFGCERGSAIAEQRIAMAKRRGMATIAAAGSDGGMVQFPACSPHVLAVGAIGRTGTFPEDSLQTSLADAEQIDPLLLSGSGLFVAPFSCIGPEVDLCAPGVAVISCQSPDSYAVCDGTSVAAPHVAALAALMLAHRVEFQTGFGRRDARRVERLFQILKQTAQPLGDPLRTGAGLPDAPRALGIQHVFVAPSRQTPASSLSELRRALRFAGLGESEPAEPARGPAVTAQLAPQFAASPIVPRGGVGAGVRDLRQAMALAGLSE
jgi:subtilisin